MLWLVGLGHLYAAVHFGIFGLMGLVTAGVGTGRERRKTNSSDPCGFESQRPVAVEPRRQRMRPIFGLTNRLASVFTGR